MKVCEIVLCISTKVFLTSWTISDGCSGHGHSNSLIFRGGDYGATVSCGVGYAAVGFCGSGRNPDCISADGNQYTNLKCCRIVGASRNPGKIPFHFMVRE